MQRVMDMGFTPDICLKMMHSAPFKGPVKIEVRGTSLTLGRRLAERVFVYVEDDEKPWIRTHPHGPHHMNTGSA